MTTKAARGFGRKAARDQHEAHGTTTEDCTAELSAFRTAYGYEHSAEFVAGYWAESLELESPEWAAEFASLLTK